MTSLSLAVADLHSKVLDACRPRGFGNIWPILFLLSLEGGAPTSDKSLILHCLFVYLFKIFSQKEKI